MKKEKINIGDTVEYIDTCQVKDETTGKTSLKKIPKQGIWDGEKVVLDDKEKTTVRNLDYLTKVNTTPKEKSKPLYEADLEIYDVWRPVGHFGLFIKLTDEYSIGIGDPNSHEPNDYDFLISQYVEADETTEVVKVGRLVFDK